MNSFIKRMIPYGIVNDREERAVANSLPKVNTDEPEIYNKKGERMRVFYLKDKASKYYYSFTAGRNSESIFWDRDNVMLPVHFYTHADMFTTMNTAIQKFGLLMEPEVMIPKVYQKLYESPELMGEFDAVFTHSEKLLNKYSNAKLYLGQGVWIGTVVGGGMLDEKLYLKKTKNVSIVSSNKAILDSHRLRIKIANELKKNPNVDAFGAFDGGPSIKIADALTKYRFNVALENEISGYYFTEKLLNCFATMTIPVYAGAKNIGEFFNLDGIVIIDKYDSMEKINNIINGCTKEFYEERLEAVLDNYNRVLKMLCVDDYIYSEYKSIFKK